MRFVVDELKGIELLVEPQEGPVLDEHDTASSGLWCMSMDRSVTGGEVVFSKETDMRPDKWKLELVRLMMNRITH
jgi:hypothetical protein